MEVVVLGMDHNLDLLKCDSHQPTEQFLDLMVNNEQWPTITRPTRITQKSVTLIDNIFVSSKLYWNFDSMVILDNISDHLLTLMLLKQTKLCNKTPIEFQSRDLIDPLKIIRISGKWQFQEPWLTTGLETTSRTCRKLYQNTLVRNCMEEAQSK